MTVKAKFIPPMLLLKTEKLPEAAGWLYQLKLDGYRAVAFKSAGNICVDTHVHRISNRLGWVTTRLPEETEQALYRAADARWWPLINLYLVTWGQNVCRPVHPRCRDCAIAPLCPRIGLT